MTLLRRENGLTLVEMLVAVAITSMVAGGLGSALYQFFTASEQSRVARGALHDIQNAGNWLNIDGKKATSTDLVDGDPATNSMTLTWTVGTQVHNATYYLSGTELRRNYNGAEISIARNVTDANFSRDGQLIAVNLTSSPVGRGDHSKEVTFNIWVRPIN